MPALPAGRVIALVDAVHADEQMNQFTIASHRLATPTVFC